MKELYKSLKIEIIEFEVKDVITTSGSEGNLENFNVDNDNSAVGYSMDY